LSPPSGSEKPTLPARIQFYGRRKGKPLKAGRLTLLDTLLPRLRIAPGDQHIDPAGLFEKKGPLRLEIGFGSGEHIAAQAAANPGVNFIGCEVFVNGVASLLRYIDEGKLTNLRIYDNDVRQLLPRLKSASFARISLPFPDPWPKSRHAKRRFVSTPMLNELARLLIDEGEFRIASDHPIYIEWCLLHAPRHPAFIWQVQNPDDWRQRPSDSTPTRYEEKALAAGRTPVFLNFLRRPRSG
jgi:tRNA (guanine-N7-)-methyltransferase